MRLLCSVYKFTSSGCTPTTAAVSGLDVNLKLTIGNTVVYNGTLDGSTGTGFIPDNEGNYVNYNLPNLGGNILYLHILFNNTWNYVDVNIELTPIAPGTYYTYNNTFRLYGYDLGNHVPIGATGNDEFNIYLDAPTVDAASPRFINYRKPFTNQIHCYNATNLQSSSFEYTDITDPLTVIDINQLPNANYCNGEACNIRLQTITSGVTCYTDVTVPKVIFIPNYAIETTCTTCSDDCTNVFDDTTAIINIDFTTLSGVNIDNVKRYWFEYLGIEWKLYNPNGTLITGTDTYAVFYLPHTFVPVTYNPNDYLTTVQPPTSGGYILKGCIGVLGYSTYIKSGALTADSYYKIKDNNTVTLSDFTDQSATANDGLLDTIFITDAAPLPNPTYGNGGQLLNVLVDGDVPAGHYYQLVNYVAGANFDNLTQTVAHLGDIFYCPVDTAPTDWGAVAPDPRSGNYTGGAIAVVDYVVKCCENKVIESCYPFDVTQTICSSIRIANLSSVLTMLVEIQKLTLTGYTVVDTITLAVYNQCDNNGYYWEEYDNLEDGIYKLIFTIGESIYIQIVPITCAIDTCELKYLNSLICSSGTNCDPCDDCTAKDYYDFNAFSLLMRNYYNTLNYVNSFGYLYDEATRAVVTSILYKLVDYIDRASSYCSECDDPCKDC